MKEPAVDREHLSAPGGTTRARQWVLLTFQFLGGVTGVTSTAQPGGRSKSALRRALSFGVVVALALTVVWSVSDVPYFWPGWIWFVLALPVVAAESVRRALRTTYRRSLAVQAAVSFVIATALIAIWLLSSHRHFWPIWPILVLIVALAGHALLMPSGSSRRERELARRVDVLARTRKGALDIQAAEMRRVERDLHDGAQARLVSLGMSLSMADELMDSDPTEARRLLADARIVAGDALGDLRALVRGILPPVLADRGLAGAIEALVAASPVPIQLTVELPDERLPAPVESAAYFAIAEALANVAKHSEAHSAWLRICLSDGVLWMVVGDDGRGGADPSRGSGLRGIERRLDAFDGTVQVSSPSGGPTVVNMELPCEQ